MGKKLFLFLLLSATVGCFNGRTIVRSEPPTASVSINGAAMGVTPLELKLDCDETGDLEIVVSRPGFVPQTKTVGCRRLLGLDRNVAFVLEPGEAPPDAATVPVPEPMETFGVLEVKSIPSGAQVYLDDKLLGTTPLTADKVKSGSYVVEVRKEGFKTWKKDLQVISQSRSKECPILEEE